MNRILLLVGLSCLLAQPAYSQPAKDDAAAELSEFRSVATAIPAKVKPLRAGQPAYLGVNLHLLPNGGLLVDHVAAGSPAHAAGLLRGDVVLQCAGKKVDSPESFRRFLLTHRPGESVTLTIERDKAQRDVACILTAVSHPMTVGARAVMGIKLTEVPDGGGIKVTEVVSGLPAQKAGIKVGDVFVKLDKSTLETFNRFNDLLSEKKPGDVANVTYLRDGKQASVAVKLEGDKTEAGSQSFDDRNLSLWKKGVYRLAVVIVDFADVKHSDKIAEKDWEESLFSEGKYRERKSVTGQIVHGSLNDYYREISYGNFHVEGKVFAPVELARKRLEYTQGANRYAVLTDALDKLLARDGADALKNFDGLFFMYAGQRATVQRGSIYWPHRASVTYKGKRWSYFICPEGGQRMESISVTAHEFGHMLGLPDLYARPEVPGAEGLGVWCTMANGHGRDGKPVHFSAWCKEQLGWLKPVVLDPTVKQKLILSPVQTSPRECFKMLIRPDASEYLLLENRPHKGFDRDLPAPGLLIWRVTNNRPFLEESHGVEGPRGPRMFLGLVPYPSKANNAFTPYTTPSSRSHQGGGTPVFITNIKKWPDGRISFFVGYEYF